MKDYSGKSLSELSREEVAEIIKVGEKLPKELSIVGWDDIEEDELVDDSVLEEQATHEWVRENFVVTVQLNSCLRNLTRTIRLVLGDLWSITCTSSRVSLNLMYMALITYSLSRTSLMDTVWAMMVICTWRRRSQGCIFLSDQSRKKPSIRSRQRFTRTINSAIDGLLRRSM